MHVESKGSIKLGNEIPHPFAMRIHIGFPVILPLLCLELNPLLLPAFYALLLLQRTATPSVVDYVMSDLGYLYLFYIICDAAPQFKNDYQLG